VRLSVSTTSLAAHHKPDEPQNKIKSDHMSRSQPLSRLPPVPEPAEAS